MTAEIFAIFFGPIIAVCITLWWQNRKEKRDAKLRLFTTLMAQRKTTPPTYDWVQALNLIDVVFAKDKRVVELWHELYALFQNPQRTQTQDHKYIELLSSRLCHFLIVAWRAKRQNPRVKRYWEIIADNLSKAGWSWGCAQRLIPTGERSGLQTRIAATESVMLCTRMRS